MRTTADRRVIAIGNWLVKLPFLSLVLLGDIEGIKRGIRANRAESLAWENKLAKMLCPVLKLWFGGVVLIQARPEPLMYAEWVTLRQIAELEPERLFGKLPLSARQVRYDAFGWYAGHAVLVDYGEEASEEP